MSNHAHARRESLVLEGAITTLRARHERGELRHEIAFSGLSVLHLARRAYAAERYEPEDLRLLCQSVLRLAAALPVAADDRREPRA